MYTLGYNILRIFHWLLFFVVVEILFYYAGWMIFGSIGVVLDGAVGTVPEKTPDGATTQLMYTIGKGVGLVAGVFFTRFCLGRYLKANGEQVAPGVEDNATKI